MSEISEIDLSSFACVEKLSFGGKAWLVLANHSVFDSALRLAKLAVSFFKSRIFVFVLRAASSVLMMQLCGE